MTKNSETYGTFEEQVKPIDPELGSICITLHEAIVELHEGYYEIVWKKQRIASYGLGPKKMSEHYTYIGIYKNHINLGFYHGAALPDPKRLLEGTGKRLRHIKIESVSKAKSSPIKQLIKDAIAERKSALA